MKDSGIHVGKIVEQAWQRSGLSGSAFSAEIGQARQNLKHVFARESMDSELLFRISAVCGEDLFAEYSQVLPWHSKAGNLVALHQGTDLSEFEMKLKIKEMELDSARKEIEYLKEIVGLLKQKG